MKADPVYAAVMSFKNILDNGIRIPKQVALLLTANAARTNAPVDLVLITGSTWSGMFLPKARNIPDSDSLIQRGRYDEILFGMELSTHDIVVVTRKDRYAFSRLPVPYTDGLLFAAYNTQ